MVNKKNSNNVKGIGGWLIFPIIGISFTIIWQLLDFFDSLQYYYFSDIYLSVIFNIIFIVLGVLILHSIYNKKKLTRKLGIWFYAISLGVNILFVGIIPAIGNLVWMLYFIDSKRVKNTFVN